MKVSVGKVTVLQSRGDCKMFYSCGGYVWGKRKDGRVDEEKLSSCRRGRLCTVKSGQAGVASFTSPLERGEELHHQAQGTGTLLPLRSVFG